MNIGRDLLKNIYNASLTRIRTLISKPPIPEGEQGIEYYGFTYYPRHPDMKDPPYEPTKLFLVRRLSSMKGLNPTERKTMALLNIDGPKRLKKHVSIVKNIAQVNALLWKVKHLVRIEPIRFVKGLPKDGDTKGTLLRSDGTFWVTEKLKINEEQLKATEKFLQDPKRFERKVMMEYLRRRWENPLTADM